ncbi:hypothetical protein L1887_20550 [Cichorium endivia]|nr:hypothetical protein L1887_20550 [Cichorium endivia]
MMTALITDRAQNSEGIQLTGKFFYILDEVYDILYGMGLLENPRDESMHMGTRAWSRFIMSGSTLLLLACIQEDAKATKKPVTVKNGAVATPTKKLESFDDSTSEESDSEEEVLSTVSSSLWNSVDVME